jgi:hypothetical protein
LNKLASGVYAGDKYNMNHIWWKKLE